MVEDFRIVMKRKCFSTLLGLLLTMRAAGQPATYYVNDGIVNTPPQIDALNFINNGTFDLFLGTLLPYQTANTLTFTNRGLMSSDTGFRFDTFSTQSGLHSSASNWVNQSTAVVNCGVSNFII